VQGTFSNPVTFQGDNLSAGYKYISGQWGEIWASPGSQSNINWAVIRNAVNGIEVDSSASLSLSHSIIKNMAGAALYGHKVLQVNADNCVFADCQEYCGYFIFGGSYSFNQCTFADYWNGGSTRTTPALYLNNWNQVSTIYPLNSAYFGNCIVYGNLANEIGIDSSNQTKPGQFSYFFDHCVLLNSGTGHLQNDSSIINKDPAFNNTSADDYNILLNSSARNTGSINIGNNYSPDLNNTTRSNLGRKPDIGAYQYKP